jgi:cytochrome c-type biogenesis protein CcmH
MLVGGLPVALLILIARPAVATAQPTTEFEGGSSSVPAADSARDAELDALTAEIASQLRCLVCRGQSVLESSSQLAREMQATIRQKLGEGETPEEIMEFFVASYGDFILLRPPAEGLNLVVYVGPIGAFVVAFIGVVIWLRRNRRIAEPAVVDASGEPLPVGNGPAPQAPAASSDLDPRDRAWLDAALRGDDG